MGVAGRVINSVLGLMGLRLSRADGSTAGSRNYISAAATVQAAGQEGLSITDYVERQWGQEGLTRAVVERMYEAGALERAATVVEIGPGTGRYTELVLQQASVNSYRIYETAGDWAEWLVANYPVTAGATDGRSLAPEADDSADLVHAHGVFVYLKPLQSYDYIQDMARIVRPGGWLVFDFYDRDFFDAETLRKCREADADYPVTLDAVSLDSFLLELGCEHMADFRNRHGHGMSTYHLYRKTG